MINVYKSLTVADSIAAQQVSGVAGCATVWKSTIETIGHVALDCNCGVHKLLINSMNIN